MSPSVSGKDHEPELEAEAGQGADEASQDLASSHRGAESQEEPVLELEPEERASLSEKERQNEEVNERDNCSASSISSSSSTLEREEKEDKLSEDRATGKWNYSLLRGQRLCCFRGYPAKVACGNCSLPQLCHWSHGARQPAASR